MANKSVSPFNSAVVRRGRGRKQGTGTTGVATSGANTVFPLALATPEQRKQFYDDMTALREKEIQFIRISRECGCCR